MGGAGGGLVYNKEELKTVCASGLAASLMHQVLVEESILGWEELELEVVSDKDNNMITVCFIENVDPVGVIEINPRPPVPPRWPSKATGFPTWFPQS